MSIPNKSHLQSKYTNVLSTDEIQTILTNEIVLIKKAELNSISRKVKFSIELSLEIKNKIQDKLGLDLSMVSYIPMRWVKGDTKPHIDKSESPFTTTYLIYLTDSRGSFIINDSEYDIKQADAFVFNEGLSHETRDTRDDERLLIGPMSEFGLPVGADEIRYFQTYEDAVGSIDVHTDPLGPTLVVANNSTLLPAPFPSFNGSWIIYSSGYPELIGTTVYPGQTLPSGSVYNVYISPPCFLEGSKILCKIEDEEKYLPIELLEKGMFVKTSLDGYKKIDMIGHSRFYIPSNSGGGRPPHTLYCCSREKYPSLFQTLYITGYHAILEDKITKDQEEKTIELLGKIYITDKKYRLLACIDDRAYPVEKEGLCTIWHLALENEDYYKNYGIYANGLLVESTSKRYLKELSGMTLK